MIIFNKNCLHYRHILYAFLECLNYTSRIPCVCNALLQSIRLAVCERLTFVLWMFFSLVFPCIPCTSLHFDL